MQDLKPFLDWNILGPDLTRVILSRLPIPSIIRATSVCKEWHYIVRSLSFISSASHYSTNHPWLFLLISTDRAFAFDPLSDRWLGPLPFSKSIPVSIARSIKTLPEIFILEKPFQMLSITMHKRRLYVLSICSSFISWLNPENQTWSPIRTLKPPGAQFGYLISCQDRLIVAGLCWFNCGTEFILWRVDEDSLEFEEIGIMPPELFSGFICGIESVRVRCDGSGNLVYVWNGGNGKVCGCEIDGNGKCSWKMIPEMPEFQVGWDSSFCRNVCLGDYLKI